MTDDQKIATPPSIPLDDIEGDDPALYGRSPAVTEALMHGYRQLATGLRLLLDVGDGEGCAEREKLAADMAEAAIRQLDEVLSSVVDWRSAKF
jgi:hypothetical protein